MVRTAPCAVRARSSIRALRVPRQWTPASEKPPFTRIAFSVVRRAAEVALTRPADAAAAFSGTAITRTEPAADATTGIARSTSKAATRAARG